MSKVSKIGPMILNSKYTAEVELGLAGKMNIMLILKAIDASKG